MLSATILGVGVRGSGLHGWSAASEVLCGRSSCDGASSDLPAPENLSARERRRISPTVRLALAAASEAAGQSALDPASLPSVFGWPHGDGDIIQRILEELCTAERYVSPMDFHNSVHNAAVGYWTIGSKAHLPCTSITAGIDSFAAALLKALAQLRAEERPILLVVVDAPFPEPLNSMCPVGTEAAAAFVLAPAGTEGGMAELDVAWSDSDASTAAPTLPRLPLYRDLWSTNGAVRAIPLLECLAREDEAELRLPFGRSGDLILKTGRC
ncbi:MAG: 3-oxoacyl-ACP synthase [Alphaproteobacteria bacterium]|nr:3-oxoacyl-ACP synthase [Alphaproteobacteria bacterium]